MGKLADDLRAARALIDTPEKRATVQGVVIAIGMAVDDAKDRAACVRAIRAVGVTGGEPHALLMALFDRAIANAERQP